MSSFPGNILLIWDRAGDYHRARYWALVRELPTLEIHLADLGGKDGLYHWSSTGLPPEKFHRLSERPVEQGDLLQRFSNFRKLLHHHKIEVIGLAGYGRVEYLVFLVWCFLRRKKVVLFAESWYGDSPLKNALKGMFLHLAAKGFLVSGQRARHHFETRLGILAEKIKMGYSVVDNEHFAAQEEVGREKILLCVARFSPEKNLEKLIGAFEQSALSREWKLLLVGGGPLKEHLEKIISKPGKVQMLDWLSYEALPLLYAQASCFILPSTFEPWGLVVNEAMAAGLPVVVSKACGCAPDLVDTSNGWIFDPEETGDLVNTLNTISQESENALRQMGKSSFQKIQRFSVKNWARHFIDLAWS